LEREYECVIVDEAHRARRKNHGLDKEHYKPEPNNLYDYLMTISKKTRSMLLATATPIQLYPVELWDLLNILSQKNDSVLGSLASNWRNKQKIAEGFELITGQKEKTFCTHKNWDWIRNPLPPVHEDTVFQILRNKSKMTDEAFVSSRKFGDFEQGTKKRLDKLIKNGFFQNHNPYIRHVVRRERAYLENTIDPETKEPYLKRIEVELFGENDSETLVLSGYMKEAYELAEAFCEELGKRSKNAGFMKTLLLKRVGSSMIAGKNTGLKMLNEWNTSFLDVEETEDDENRSDLKNLTGEETTLLEHFVRALEANESTDPKYHRCKELLLGKKWLERGVIIFSQYYDTAFWVAKKLSLDIPQEAISLYAGGDKSGIFVGGEFKKVEKEQIKSKVQNRELRVLVGTDAASEGLNLQKLGSLINLDLPWNPTKLEQRKGRIQRIGQVFDKVFVYNMRYRDSVEDKVHKILSKRLKNIYGIFGQLPDVLEDVWINVALADKEEASRIIDNIPKKHPFESRYNNGVSHSNWEGCSDVLNQKEKRRYLKKGW
jgi:hypothetical protein